MEHQNLLSSNGRDDYDRIPVRLGGFGGTTQEESAKAIGLIHKGLLGVPNGVAYIGPNGVLPAHLLDTNNSVDAITISGPTSMSLSATVTFLITNYDFLTEYVVTAVNGAVAIVDNIITYTAPDSGAMGGFVINGFTYSIVLNNSSSVNKPTIVTPNSGVLAQPIGPDVNFSVSTFGVISGSDLHESTDWQISDTENFATLVKSSIGSAVNKTSWTATDLPADTVLYVRVRYKGNVKGYSLWSNVISLKTKKRFAPQKPKIIAPVNDSSQHGLAVVATSSDFVFPDSSLTLKSVIFELWKGSIEFGQLISTNTSGTSLSKTFSSLEINNGYKVRVKHIASDDSVSDWSDEVTFLTVDSVSPTKPVVLTPVNNITNASSFVDVTWTAFQGKLGDTQLNTEVAVKLLSDADFPAPTVVTDQSTLLNIGPLTADTPYQVRVRHNGVTGGPSEWSNVVNFRTLSSFIAAPILTTNSIANNGPLYEVQATNYSGEGVLALTEWSVKDNNNSIAVTYTLNAPTTWLTAHPDRLLREGRSYTIKARRKNSLNNWSPWSDPLEINSVAHYLAKPINTLLSNAVVNRRSISPMFQFDWSSDIVYSLTSYSPNRITGTSVNSYEYQFSNDGADPIFATNAANVVKNVANATLSVTIKPKSYIDSEGNERFRLYARARELMTYPNPTKDSHSTNFQIVSEWSDIKAFNVLTPYSYREIAAFSYGYYDYIAPSYYPRTAKVVGISEETKRVVQLSTNYSPGEIPGTSDYLQENINKLDIFKIDDTGVMSLEFTIYPPSNSHVRHSFGDKCVFNNDATLLFIKVTPTEPEGGGFINGYVCVFRRTDNVWTHSYDIHSTESQTFAADIALSDSGTRLFVTSQSKGIPRYSNGDFGIVTLVYDVTTISYTKLYTVPINIDATVQETYYDLELYDCGDNAFAIKSKTNNTLNNDKKQDIYYYYYNGSTWVANNTNFGSSFVTSLNLARTKYAFTGYAGNNSGANLYKIDASGSNVVLTSYYLEPNGGTLAGGRYRLIATKVLGSVISNGLSFDFCVGKDGRIFISDIGARRLRVLDYSTALSEYKEYENFSFKTGVDNITGLKYMNAVDCFFARQHGIVSSNETRATDVILTYRNIG